MVRGKFVILLCVIDSLILALRPFEFSDTTADSLTELLAGFTRMFPLASENVVTRDFFQNIAYFVLFGIVLFFALASRVARRTSRVLIVGLVGGLVSFGIELCQVFFVRHASAFDVLANTLGATLGSLISSVIPNGFRCFAVRVFSRVATSSVLLPMFLVLGLLPLIVTVTNSPWFDFHNWDRSFTFQIGNEGTMNRPWLGTIRLVAIYDWALSPEEIARRHGLGPSREALPSHVKGNLIALYAFAEGSGSLVRDTSAFGAPLGLTLSPRSHFRWLPRSNGIEILAPGIIKSAKPAEKLFDSLLESNELSIEVWMNPTRVEQKGPARIVSLSRDAYSRNFTLGQESADIDFRLRTPISGGNGSVVNLRTRNGFLEPKTFHLVVTYKDGVESLYVDGSAHQNSLDLKKAEIIVAFGSGKNPIAQLAYIFVYFFPVSVFLSVFLARHSGSFARTILIPVAVGIALLSTTEIFQSYAFGRSPDIALIGYGLPISAIGGLIGLGFARGRL